MSSPTLSDQPRQGQLGDAAALGEGKNHLGNFSVPCRALMVI